MADRPISKTQLELWTACERKWYWSYLVDGLRMPNASAELGIRVHKQLEEWFKNKTPPDHTTEEGLIAESGLHLWPPPDDNMLVEHELKREWAHGFADLLFQRTDDVVVVGDHKTTSDFKWANTEESLAEDIQANLYSWMVLENFDLDLVENRWVYMRTRGAKKAIEISRMVHREEAARFVEERLKPHALTLQEHWRTKKVLPVLRAKDEEVYKEFEFNPRECSNYGGCQYRDLCNLTPRDRQRARFAHMGLADQMRARAAANKAAPDTKIPDPINPPEKPKGAGPGALAAKAAMSAAPAAPKAAETPPKVTTTPPKAEPTPAPKVEAPLTSAILLVGCFPTHGSNGLLYADQWIGTAKAVIESELGLPDYRLADFGKGPGMLAAAVRQALADDPIPSGSMVFLDNRTDEGRAAYEAFRECCSIVVRAL